MNEFMIIYCNALEEYLEILRSKKLQNKLILNINNDSNEMVLLEEILEEMFGSRYEDVKKYGYIKEEFLIKLETLYKLLNKSVNHFNRGVSLNIILDSPEWCKITILSNELYILLPSICCPVQKIEE